MATKIIRYAEIKGKKVKLFSPQDRIAHFQNIPHDHFTIDGKKETVQHFPSGKVQVNSSKRAKGYERSV